MGSRSNLVNLDAMISRADFASESPVDAGYENITTISVRDFTKEGLIGPGLRKPDFQRETNHWTPQQVASLLECFANGDLIPSVILWQSPTYLFVIDGGHRLSAIRAWVEDDYGDRQLSYEYFGHTISAEQRKTADRTRELINNSIGSFASFKARLTGSNIEPNERRIVTTLAARGLPIQWVKGDADKAEASFFKINTKGTPLDSIEELLLKNRKRPIAIAARAIIRAGAGHKYWSSFSTNTATLIESKSKELHAVLLEPELKRPIKTLDLPLGGSKGVRVALQVLIDFLIIAIRGQDESLKHVEQQPEDPTGSETLKVLSRALSLASRISGNSGGSLGLHPAVYFYGPSGRHSSAMFMGTIEVIARRLANNDSTFFKEFTAIRGALEDALVEHKDLLATVLQKHSSAKRPNVYSRVLGIMISTLKDRQPITEDLLVEHSGLGGKLLVGATEKTAPAPNDDAKSSVFITSALTHALRCPVCNGYLDSEKSISYDHIVRVRDGGTGSATNLQLTHPYCNQSVKQ